MKLPESILVILEPDYFSRDAARILQSHYKVLEFGDSGSHQAEVLVAGLARRLDSDFLKDFPKLRLVAVITTGTNHVDSAYLESRGVQLKSLNSLKSEILGVRSTAELTLGLMFAAGRRITQSHHSVVEAEVWNRMDFYGPELRGQKLGVIGYGRIGRMVAEMAQTLGLRVHAFDPLDLVPPALKAGSLEEVLADSDIISLHASYSGTEVLGAAEIRQVKPSSLLINTARGELVSEESIASAIKSGHLGGYAADVLAGENRTHWKMGSDSLVSLARKGYNVTITPHLGGCTIQGFHVTQVAMARYLVSSTSWSGGV